MAMRRMEVFIMVLVENVRCWVEDAVEMDRPSSRESALEMLSRLFSEDLSSNGS